MHKLWLTSDIFFMVIHVCLVRLCARLIYHIHPFLSAKYNIPYIHKHVTPCSHLLKKIIYKSTKPTATGIT